MCFLRVVMITLFMANSLAGCGKTVKEPLDPPRLGAPPEPVYGRGRLGPIAGSPQDFQSGDRDLVYFASDSSDLTPEARQVLDGQAAWLRQYPSATVLIEGHADERGTREYNIALGVRRAQAVRDYLASHAIAAGRIRTISFGKEQPVSVCNDISCWSRNRRAQTVVGASALARR